MNCTDVLSDYPRGPGRQGHLGFVNEMTDINRSLSIIIPCLNEEETVVEVISQALFGLDKFGIQGDVIVVNDGSTDETQYRVREILGRDHRVSVIDKEATQGVGAAFWDSCMRSTSDFVVMLPGDNENSIDQVLRFFDLVDRVDVVVPFVQNREVRHRVRRVISGTYRWIINLSFGTQLNYTNGTVIYNRMALMSVELNSHGFFFQTELLIKLLRRGFLYAEVPQLLGQRARGRSTALSFRSLFQLIASFTKFFLRVHVLRIEGLRDPRYQFPPTTVTGRALLSDDNPDGVRN